MGRPLPAACAGLPSKRAAAGDCAPAAPPLPREAPSLPGSCWHLQRTPRARADLAGEWDDADDDLFQQRLARAEASLAEAASASGKTEDAVFEGGLRIPGRIFSRLFDYQKTGAGSGAWTPKALGPASLWGPAA